MKKTPFERFFDKVEITEGCWNWIAGRDANGYGKFRSRISFDSGYAHRFAYEQFVSQIPSGLEIDHLCRNKSCVNPDHLEAVTTLENMRRVPSSVRLARVEWMRQLTHCKHGHEFTPANTYVNRRGHRQCRSCQRERKAAQLL